MQPLALLQGHYSAREADQVVLSEPRSVALATSISISLGGGEESGADAPLADTEAPRATSRYFTSSICKCNLAHECSNEQKVIR